MPRGRQVIRQWTVLSALEHARTGMTVEQTPDEVMVEMQLLVNDLKSAIKAIETAAELLGSMVPSHAEAEDKDPVEI